MAIACRTRRGSTFLALTTSTGDTPAAGPSTEHLADGRRPPAATYRLVETSAADRGLGSAPRQRVKQQGDGVADGQRGTAPDEGIEILSGEQLHDDEGLAALGAPHVVDLGHVLAEELRGHARLPEEARHRLG